MTAAEIVEQVAAAGGVLTLTGGGERIRAELPEDAQTLLDGLREHKAEVIRLLRERRCRTHGDRATWWERPTGGYVCGLCHPDPYSLANQQAQQAGPPTMPEGVRLLEWAPKNPPIAITTWSVVNDVPKFIHATLAQLDAALRGKTWQSRSLSVRELCERLEQAGVRVEVTA
jgi:hypothetical protein